jgi:hypothetical protein
LGAGLTKEAEILRGREQESGELERGGSWRGEPPAKEGELTRGREARSECQKGARG